MISEIFKAILYQPLFNALIFLYETVAFNDLGVAIILLTIVVRTILYPLFHKTAKHQRIAQQLNPEINKIRKKYKDDKEQQTKAILELYQREKTNPITPFFLLLLQLPVLFALYRLFSNGFSEDPSILLYPFWSFAVDLNTTFLGLISLKETYIPMVVLAAGAQYIQAKISIARVSKNKDSEQSQAQSIMKLTTYIGPIIALLILVRLPSAVALYWLTSTIFSIIQQIIVNKAVENKDDKPRNAEQST